MVVLEIADRFSVFDAGRYFRHVIVADDADRDRNSRERAIL
jgi:hypothetical protein